jgi:hypothetical protein
MLMMLVTTVITLWVRKRKEDGILNVPAERLSHRHAQRACPCERKKS